MIRVGWMMADASWCSLPFTRSLLSFDPRAPPSHLNAKVHPAKHLHPVVYLCCKVYTRFKVLPAPCRTPCSSASKPQKSTPKVQSAPCGTDPVPASWPQGRSLQKVTKSADSSGKSELFLKAGRTACSIQAFLKSVTKHRRFIVARQNRQPAVSQFRKKSDVCRRLRERQDSQSSRLLEEPTWVWKEADVQWDGDSTRSCLMTYRRLPTGCGLNAMVTSLLSPRTNKGTH